MSARAILRNAPISAQKARLIADMVRNRKVEQAQDILAFCPRAGARIISKLLHSAVANARDLEKNERWHGGSDLDVRPRARGMAYRILRRRCHIAVEVDDRTA